MAGCLHAAVRGGRGRPRRRFGAADLGGAASLVLLVCAILAVAGHPSGAVLLRWLARLAESRRSRRPAAHGSRFSSVLHGVAEALLPPARDGWALGPASLVAVGRYPQRVRVARDRPGALLVGPRSRPLFRSEAPERSSSLVSSTAARAAAKGWSLTSALAALGRTLACVLPAMGALAGSVIASGRFVVAEMVAEQGGAPWRWASTRNPGLFVLFFVLVASVIPEADPSDALPAGRECRPSARRARRRRERFSG